MFEDTGGYTIWRTKFIASDPNKQEPQEQRQKNDVFHTISTPGAFNIAVENGSSTVDLPIKNGDFP